MCDATPGCAARPWALLRDAFGVKDLFLGRGDASSSGSGFEEFDGVAVGVFDLDLLAAGAGDEGGAEVDALVLEFGDAGEQLVDLEDDAVAAAGFLGAAVQQRARARGTGAAEDELEIGDGNLAEGGQVLHVEVEAEGLGVEGNGALDVFDLVADAPEGLDEGWGGHVACCWRCWRLLMGTQAALREPGLCCVTPLA